MPIGENCFACEACGEVKDYEDLSPHDDSADVCKQCFDTLATENREMYCRLREAVNTARDNREPTVTLNTTEMYDLFDLADGWLAEVIERTNNEMAEIAYYFARRRSERFLKALLAANRRRRVLEAKAAMSGELEDLGAVEDLYHELTTARTENERLEGVLGFYADPENWRTKGHPQIDAMDTPVRHDKGKVAREALPKNPAQGPGQAEESPSA